MKKFSVIGANSSLAKNFIYFLRDKEVTLTLYDIQEKSDDNCKNYNQINFSCDGDIQEIDFDCDAVFIFSGLTGAETSMRQAAEFIDANEKFLVKMLDKIKDSNARCRVVYPSSRLVYKDVDGILEENSQLEAKSVYALNKIACENYLKLYHEIYGIDYTVFRIAIPFGELNPVSAKYGIVSKLQEQSIDGEITLFGSGDSVRTFTHIKNICEILYSGSLMKQTLNDIFNIGGKTYSLFEIASVFADKYKSHIVYKPWPNNLYKLEIKNGRLSSEKLDAVLQTDYIDIKDYLKNH